MTNKEENNKALEQYQNSYPDKEHYHLSDNIELDNVTRENTKGAMNWLDDLVKKYKK